MRRFSQLVWMALILGAAPYAFAKTDAEGEPISSIRNFHSINAELLTAGQVQSQHLDAIAASDIKLVINLAPASSERNREEGFLIVSEGISYIQIPVLWGEPTDADLALFFAVMDARDGRKTLVHCFANYRASAFTYLYRVIKQGVDEGKARVDLLEVWDDEAFAHAKQWRQFIDRHLNENGVTKS